MKPKSGRPLKMKRGPKQKELSKQKIISIEETTRVIMKESILSESKKTPARINSRSSGMRTPNYLSGKQTPKIDNIA